MTEQEKKARVIGALRSALETHNCDHNLLEDRAERMYQHDASAGRPPMAVRVVDEQVPDPDDESGRRTVAAARVRVVDENGSVLKGLDNITPLPVERYVREYVLNNSSSRWTLTPLASP